MFGGIFYLLKDLQQINNFSMVLLHSPASILYLDLVKEVGAMSSKINFCSCDNVCFINIETLRGPTLRGSSL